MMDDLDSNLEAAGLAQWRRQVNGDIRDIKACQAQQQHDLREVLKILETIRAVRNFFLWLSPVFTFVATILAFWLGRSI